MRLPFAFYTVMILRLTHWTDTEPGAHPKVRGDGGNRAPFLSAPFDPKIKTALGMSALLLRLQHGGHKLGLFAPTT